MQRIPLQQVTFLPQSFADPNGRLFWWEGQLYRGITPSMAGLYRRLFAEGIVQRLVDKGLLIETKPASFEMEGYPFVLWHRTLPFVSYPYEWCAAMLKDAARMLINLEIELVSYGLTLQDAHVWNVLFDGYKPIYVDFNSIIPAEGAVLWPPYEEFCRFFVRPLHLMAWGHGRIARWLLHDFEQGVLESDMLAMSAGMSWHIWLRRVVSESRRYIPGALKQLVRKGRTLIQSRPGSSTSETRSRLAFLLNLKQEVEDIPDPPLKTEWSDYYDGKFPELSQTDGWTAKHIVVKRVLDDLHPASVLDVGSNRGWFAQLAAQYATHVVAFDTDEVCIAQLYHDAKEKKLPILPLVMNFKNPSPGYGLSNRWLTPAIQRFVCDLVLALALVHHLVFKQRLNFDQIAQALSVFARRWLLVEFVPREDKYVCQWWSEQYSWYTVDNFITALARYFGDIKVYSSDPAPRLLLLCTKKMS